MHCAPSLVRTRGGRWGWGRSYVARTATPTLTLPHLRRREGMHCAPSLVRTRGGRRGWGRSYVVRSTAPTLTLPHLRRREGMHCAPSLARTRGGRRGWGQSYVVRSTAPTLTLPHLRRGRECTALLPSCERAGEGGDGGSRTSCEVRPPPSPSPTFGEGGNALRSFPRANARGKAGMGAVVRRANCGPHPTLPHLRRGRECTALLPSCERAGEGGDGGGRTSCEVRPPPSPSPTFGEGGNALRSFPRANARGKAGMGAVVRRAKCGPHPHPPPPSAREGNALRSFPRAHARGKAGMGAVVRRAKYRPHPHPPPPSAEGGNALRSFPRAHARGKAGMGAADVLRGTAAPPPSHGTPISLPAALRLRRDHPVGNNTEDLIFVGGHAPSEGIA